jgi:ribose transport system ATP-binding protein
MGDLLVARNLCKAFPGVRALDGVNFSIRAGEVHALVGENGAGKSTLIKLLMGVYQPSSGEVEIKGEKVAEFSPEVAKAHGLAAVYQDISLAKALTVGENFFLGDMPTTRFGVVDWTQVHKQSGDFLKRLGLPIDPRTPLKKLSVAMQEMVAIAKPVFDKADILIFDEPTALLAEEETKILFSIIAKLKAEGKGIVYISHRMEEIFAICDRVTVLKDGKYVDTMDVADTNQDDLMKLMVGRSMVDMYNIHHTPPGATVLRVDRLCHGDHFRDISFDLHKGEIFGLFGLVGSGRTEVMRAIFGADPIDDGQVVVDDRPVKFRHPHDAIEAGIGFMAEDRKAQSLAMPLSIRTNVNLANYPRISRFGVIDVGRERQTAEDCIERLRVKTPSDTQAIRNLSGGNQQKVVLGKNLATEAHILICDEPTIGVDVGAKSEIYKIFEKLTSEGLSILLVSSYLPEIMGLADRVLVLYEGRSMGIVSRQDFNEEKFVRLASGLAA